MVHCRVLLLQQHASSILYTRMVHFLLFFHTPYGALTRCWSSSQRKSDIISILESQLLLFTPGSYLLFTPLVQHVLFRVTIYYSTTISGDILEARNKAIRQSIHL